MDSFNSTIVGKNGSFGQKHPDLLKEWDYSRNNVETEPYYVMLYIRRDSDNIAQSVSSCIIKRVSGDNPIVRYECVAGQDGVKGNCGDCPIN